MKKIFVNIRIFVVGLLSFVAMCFLFLIMLILLGVVFLNFPAFRSDYCIEDGVCEEGRIIWHDDEEILINKENCLKYNWVWYDKGMYCKVGK